MSWCRRTQWLVMALAAVVAMTAATAVWARPLADSVILFIGDGMGPAHIALAREAAGGEPLAMERMPYSGLVTTRSAGDRVTDSAAAATALATGNKTNNGMIAVAPDGHRLPTILERCQNAHKSTGLATTDSIYGATPASFAAHVSDRGERAEIARQLAASRVQVMLGFGRGEFLPKSAGGGRDDGRDLIAELRKAGYEVVSTKEELAASERHMVAGLFDGSAPTLPEMVEAALPKLAINADGFLLMAEGAPIDWTSHDNDPAGMVREVWELDAAVRATLDFARRRGRTLVLVTADHETGGLQIDRPERGAALGGVKASASEMAGHLNQDRTNVAQVLAEFGGLEDPTQAEVEKIKAAEDAASAISAVLGDRAGVVWASQGHTATMVKVFAYGPGAERFTGEMDNTDIPKRIAEVLGIGPFPE
jgi:alkaline phosphatase